MIAQNSRVVKGYSPNFIPKKWKRIITQGKNHPLYGRILPPETIKKMSKAKKGKNNPMYGLKGKDSPTYGTKRSPEQIKKISGKNHHMYGKRLSLEIIEKMRLAQCIKKETVLEILELLNKKVSVKDIVKKIDVGKSVVYKVKNGFYNNIYNLKKEKNKKLRKIA